MLRGMSAECRAMLGAWRFCRTADIAMDSMCSDPAAHFMEDSMLSCHLSHFNACFEG